MNAMRKILLLSALSIGLLACQESSVSTAPDEGTVALAPRIIRTESVPVPLFNGTDRVRVEVYDVGSGNLLKSVSASFSQHTLLVDGIPSNANVRVDVYGLDASGSTLWYGSGSAVSASSAATSGVGVNADVSIYAYKSNATPYIGDWVYVNASGSLDDLHDGQWTTLAHFGEDGACRWENFFVNADGDVLSRYVGEGTCVQVGSSLTATLSDVQSCNVSGSYPASTCNSDASLQSYAQTGWTGQFTANGSGLDFVLGTSANFPFEAVVGDATRYYPLTGSWIESYQGTSSPATGVTLEGTWTTTIEFAAAGTYVWVETFAASTTGRVTKHYVESGNYTRSGTNITLAPTVASKCDAGAQYLTLSCADISDGISVTPPDPVTWTYTATVGKMHLVSTGGTTWDFVKQPTAMRTGL